jgi:hypothetical protein
MPSRKLPLALDFAGNLGDVLSQPFRLVFTTIGGPGQHTPDFLAVTHDGTRLIDVRPGRGSRRRTGPVCGRRRGRALVRWRYAVAAGWLPNEQATLDTLSAQRRTRADPLHRQPAPGVVPHSLTHEHAARRSAICVRAWGKGAAAIR